MKPYDRDKIDFARSLRKERHFGKMKLWFIFEKLSSKISKAKNHRTIYRGFLLQHKQSLL